jgi:hypothetical protein
MTLSTRAIDWNRRQRARGGGRGNDRGHPWFPCDFREFFCFLGREEGRELKYPSEKFAYVGISTRSSAK